MPAIGRQLGRCPAALQGKMLAPRNGGTRLCRQWGANSAGDRQRSRAKCFFGPGLTLGRCRLGAQIPAAPCSFVPFAPSLQAFSALGRHGLGAQTPAKPCSFVPFAPSLRAFSALGRRRLGAQIPAKPCSFVPFAPSLRTVSALGRRGLGAQTPARPCSFVPFAPSLRTFSALGGKFPAGALKEEKENGRGQSPFALSLNYSYAVYRSSRYLYRSSASFMYCDAPENILDKLNR